MITVPKSFIDGVVRSGGDEGRAWLDDLPRLIEGLCDQWSLSFDGDGAPMHGHLGLVVPVLRGDEAYVLKVSWDDESTQHEALALSTWDGAGAAKLFASNPACGAMLLERLNGARSLMDVPIDEAVDVAGRLLRRLAVPAPDGPPHLSDVAGRLAEALPERWEWLGRPMTRRTMERARTYARELGPAAHDRLVNYDLHYGNVLAGAREPWLAIDPKVVLGDPEFGVAQLLWRRLDDMDGSAGLHRQFQRLIELAELDRERTRLWTVVRLVDYWLWGVSIGLTEDPARCEAILGWIE